MPAASRMIMLPARRALGAPLICVIWSPSRETSIQRALQLPDVVPGRKHQGLHFGHKVCVHQGRDVWQVLPFQHDRLDLQKHVKGLVEAFIIRSYAAITGRARKSCRANPDGARATVLPSRFRLSRGGAGRVFTALESSRKPMMAPGWEIRQGWVAEIDSIDFVRLN